MKKRGFTLIELLVVIAIIGILTGIVLVSLRGARARAYDAEIKTEISQIKSEAEIYYTATGTYTGFTVPTQFKPPACSPSTDYLTDISADGESIAIYAQLCSNTSLYWCVDSAGAAKETTTDPGATADGLCP